MPQKNLIFLGMLLKKTVLFYLYKHERHWSVYILVEHPVHVSEHDSHYFQFQLRQYIEINTKISIYDTIVV